MQRTETYQDTFLNQARKERTPLTIFLVNGFQMRAGYADRVFIVTSGENMALHAAANIAMAVENFRGRGYASLGGLILNRRNVKNEEEKVRELAGDISSQIVGSLDFSETVQQAEALSQTVIEAFPESEMAAQYRALADAVLRACEVAPC